MKGASGRSWAGVKEADEGGAAPQIRGPLPLDNPGTGPLE